LELNCGQTIWDKNKVLLRTSWGTHFGTFWKFDGNKGKTQNASPLAHQKEKKLDHQTIHEYMLHLLIGCMKFLFPKLFVTIF
jgi:hypothetical protein